MADKQLDAVNYLLSLLGSNPVSTLSNPHPFTTKAITRLSDASHDVQKEGWWFNTEYHVVIEPDEFNDIVVPTNTLTVTVESKNAITLRGTRLYDTIAHTYAFTEAVTMNIIVELDFNLLELSVQDTVKYFAGVAVCDFDLEDGQKAAKVEKFFTKSQIEMKKTDLRSQRRNILNSPATARTRAGVQPYGSRGGRNPLYPGG